MANSSDCTSADCSQIYLTRPPVLVGNIILLVFFAVPLPVALALGIKYKSSGFTTAIVAGLALEIVGYVGRLLLHNDSNSETGFALFLAGTTLGPTCICGAIFLTMPRIVAVYGDEYRSWRPTWYLFLLSTFTAVSLVLELAGSALSAVQDSSTTVDVGSRVLIVGVAIQLIALIIFVLHATFFAVALRTRQHDVDTALTSLYNSRQFKAFLTVFTGATILVVLRTAYRIVLITEWLENFITQSETVFLILDGAVMLIATVLLLVCFPPRALGEAWSKRAVGRLSRQPPRPVRDPALYQFPLSHLNPTNQMGTQSSASAQPARRNPYSAPPQRDMVDPDDLW
ncbi:hypothetical protein F4861DRAFT_541267 [Xylaria intraflava]|nr:hypothetical protein F4861DRAFT_541267 [Xylaria intraflava]